jgi:predicted acetyltransferase
VATRHETGLDASPLKPALIFRSANATEPVALLGGATLPEWRGRGLYRAMIAARAREAVARGFRLLHLDASPASAPILRRCGFHEITTSTHYQWTSPE